MKKIVALLLAVMMVMSMAACANNNQSETTGAATTAGTTAPALPYTPVDDGNVDFANGSINAGEVTANKLTGEGGGEVGYDVYAGIAGKDYTDPEVYTYNTYTAGTTNMKWSTHTWETSDDSAILDYITSGFYTFNLNSTADGWSISCEMAAELPVDVTADYVGQFGIEAGETGRAWKIALNQLACWEDGTPINADSYIYSYKELLDPAMKNRRADSLYAGDFVIVGAKNYFYQGQTAYNPIASSVADFVAAGGNEAELYVDMSFWGVSSADGSGYQLVTDDTMVRDPAVADEKAAEAFVSGKYLYETYLKDGAPYASYGADYLCTKVEYEDNFSWDNVGVVKTGEYELVFVTDSPIEDANYYVPYNLSSTYLVYEPMWESCKSFFDADGNTVKADSDKVTLITTNYCTNKDNTMSYGPYKLTYFELDKQYTLERNDTWYGYKDGKHVGQYQTDIISTQVIAEHATQLLAFLNGELDDIGLQSDDMATYGSSDYIRYTPQSFTTKLTFNTDLAALETRGTQILANAHFRKGFGLAIDRTQFATAYTSAGSAGYGLLNSMYVYDPFTGAAYRDTDGAKAAIVDLFDLTYGPDGDYGSLDEAYEAVTGYDLEYAKQLMTQAYYECVDAGYYDGTSNVEIQISVYASDDIYVQMFNFLNDALKAACAGTPFEGKVALKMVADADYYETMYSGGTDIIFTTWGGAAYSPYTMLNQCYCDASDGSGNQMEYGFDTNKITVTMTINGVEYTDSLHDWAYWAGGDLDYSIVAADGTDLGKFADYDADSRAAIFGKLENAYLEFYATTSMYYRNSASLVSQQVVQPVTTYVDLVGFGGIQFYTYNYTDAEWADVVAKGLTY